MHEKEIKVRGLKWSEKKALEEEGLDFRNLEPDKSGFDEKVEKVVLMCAEDPEGVAEAEVMEVYRAFFKIVEKTFPSRGAEKNLSGRQNWPPMENSGAVVDADKQD